MQCLFLIRIKEGWIILIVIFSCFNNEIILAWQEHSSMQYFESPLNKKPPLLPLYHKKSLTVFTALHCSQQNTTLWFYLMVAPGYPFVCKCSVFVISFSIMLQSSFSSAINWGNRSLRCKDITPLYKNGN